MQREDSDGIVISCDFCRLDWNGQDAMMEGHHGSIICLPCLQRALAECVITPLANAEDKYKCTLCLRFNIPSTVAHWQNPDHPEAIACRECIVQAAGTFSKSPHANWTWDRKIAH